MKIEHPRRTQALIDLTALKHNLQKLKALMGAGEFFCPMVKANAYGHGAAEVAKVCSSVGADAVGVALYSEAKALRDEGVEIPILVFEPDAKIPLSQLQVDRLLPVVSSFSDLQKLAGTSCKVHLKFNTGMNRLGFKLQEIEPLKEFLTEHPEIQVAGVCSHLSHGHDVGTEAGQSKKQIDRFRRIESEFKSVTDCFHFWNSSGLLATKAREVGTCGWGARPGISIYGAYTERSIEDAGVARFVRNLAFQPVMRLKAHVTQSYRISKGEIVSYGGIWKSQRDSIIAVLSLGYADGYSRHNSNRAVMGWKKKQVPVVGRVCMDYTMLDVTDAVKNPDEIVGEEVIVFGVANLGEPSAEDCASRIHTISYEVLTGVSPRVPRVFVGAANG